jgi:ATP synthase F1 delta subunit
VREALRGYAAAVLEAARAEGREAEVAEELAAFARALVGDERLYWALTDAAVPLEARRAIVEDLLATASRDARRLLGRAVDVERAGELPPAVEWLVSRAEDEIAVGRTGVGSPGLALDPPAGRHATRERVEGFATAVFEDLASREAVEEVEDELFRFTRTLEASEPLRHALVGAELPVEVRRAIVEDLLSGRAQPATVRLVGYAVASTRGRGLVELLDALVERAAAERGLRIAEVHTAVELDEGQRRRLAEALARRTGRDVELRVTVDPSLVGGMRVIVGDTVIDGTLRRRLDELGASLAGRPLR